MTAAYDPIAQEYAEFVAAALDDPAHVLRVASECLLHAAGEVRGLAVCDLGCGEGHLARRLAAEGARVAGVDNSSSLLALATEGSSDDAIHYRLDDAQHLNGIGDGTFDLALSNFSLMDIPDLAATYRAVFRVLKPRGRFLFSITHPCFQLPRVQPRPSPDGADEATVQDYYYEGFWTSSWKSGIRGRVGAHHRTLSTYLNELIRAGFTLRDVAEPRIADELTPKILVVSAAKA